jgi:hypothetical protein
MQTLEELEAIQRPEVATPVVSPEQAITEEGAATVLAQFVRLQGVLRSGVRPVYEDHIEALDEAAPVGVKTAKEDARRLAQRKLGAGYRWIFFEDAWRTLPDDRKVLSLRHRRRAKVGGEKHGQLPKSVRSRIADGSA